MMKECCDLYTGFGVAIYTQFFLYGNFPHFPHLTEDSVAEMACA